MSEQQPPLPEDWEARDSHDCFFEYIAHCRAERRAGLPLPAMFVPSEWVDLSRNLPNDTLDDMIDEAKNRNRKVEHGPLFDGAAE